MAEKPAGLIYGVDDRPLPVTLTLTVSGSELHFDFTGTAPAARGPMNISDSTAKSLCFVALKHVFPDVPVTKKPAEVRMGSGKGAPELWVARVKPGRIMFELDGVSDATAREALGLGAAKLPIKTRIVTRQA